MDELMELVRKLNMSREDVINEAECVRDYGEWLHVSLIGYTYDELMEVANEMDIEEKVEEE